MSYSNALSPEINELFTTIEHQTVQYANAFEQLNSKINEFENNIKTLEQYKAFFSKEFTNLAAETKVNVNTSLSELDEKLHKVLNLHSQFEQIVSFRESLVLLHNQLRTIINSTSTNLTEFKTKSDFELTSTLNSMRFRINKEIEALSLKYESKIDFKLKRLETQLLTYDQKIANVIDYQNTELKNVRDDLDSMRSKVHNLFKDKEPDEQNRKNKANSQIAMLQEMFDEKFDILKKQLKQVNDIANDDTEHQKAIDKLNSDISVIMKTISESKSNETKLTQKQKSSQVLTIFAFIIALIALILAISK